MRCVLVAYFPVKLNESNSNALRPCKQLTLAFLPAQLLVANKNKMKTKLVILLTTLLTLASHAQSLYFGDPPIVSGFGGLNRAVSVRAQGVAPNQFINCRYWLTTNSAASSYASIAAFPGVTTYEWYTQGGVLYIRPAGFSGSTAFPLHIYSPTSHIAIRPLVTGAAVTVAGLPGAYGPESTVVVSVAVLARGTFVVPAGSSNTEVLRFRPVVLAE